MTQYPKQLKIGTTVIIMAGTMANRVVLCQQRRDNWWFGFPGGAQELGESVADAARREVLEETGLQVVLLGVTSIDSDPAQYGACTYPDGVIQYTNITFLAGVMTKTWEDAPEVRCCEESLALEWYPPHRLPQPFLLSHAWRLEQALAHKGPFLPVR